MGLAEVAGHDGPVHGGDDLGQGDLLGGAGQDVAAPDAPLGADQAGTFEGEEDLLEVGLGQAGPLGDVPHRGRDRLGPRAGRGTGGPGWRSRPGSRPLTHPMLLGPGRSGAGCPTGRSAPAVSAPVASSTPCCPPSAGPVSPAWCPPCWASSPVAGAAAGLDPRPVARARQVVLLVLDGLGPSSWRTRRVLAPTLAAASAGAPSPRSHPAPRLPP